MNSRQRYSGKKERGTGIIDTVYLYSILLCFSVPSLPPCHSLSLLRCPDLWVLLVINALVSIYGASVTENSKGTYLVSMGISFVYVLLFVPGSLCCWFLPGYYAYR